jgi:hypothetical protein
MLMSVHLLAVDNFVFGLACSLNFSMLFDDSHFVSRSFTEV